MAPPAILRGDLTQQGYAILRAIGEFSDVNGYAPTVREIGETLGMASSSSPYNVLVALRAMGAVTWKPDSFRTLVLTPAGRNAIEAAL
jgi:repressor LexA